MQNEWTKNTLSELLGLDFLEGKVYEQRVIKGTRGDIG